MKKEESLLSKKFAKNEINLSAIYGGDKVSTGECHGTGCDEATGKTDTNPGVIDWEDIECGTENYPGTVVCPNAFTSGFNSFGLTSTTFATFGLTSSISFF